jgi:hypothetical protein
MAINVFAVPSKTPHSIPLNDPTNSPLKVFFVVFRESLEVVVVVSVLFAFLKQTLSGPGTDPIIFRKLCKQVRLDTTSLP